MNNLVKSLTTITNFLVEMTHKKALLIIFIYLTVIDNYVHSCNKNSTSTNSNGTTGTTTTSTTFDSKTNEENICKSCDNTTSVCTFGVCICRKGYEKGKNDLCEDVNECETMCQEKDYNCTNTPGSYACRESNWALCRKIKCDNQSDCHVKTGIAFCICRKGYSQNNDGLCVDIDECDSKDSCNLNTQMCTNTRGSFYCTCQLGFTERNNSCHDENECQGYNSCSYTNEHCINTQGSYKCICKSDFVRKEGVCSRTVLYMQSKMVLGSVLFLFIVTNLLFIPLYWGVLKSTTLDGKDIQARSSSTISRSYLSSKTSIGNSSKRQNITMKSHVNTKRSISAPRPLNPVASQAFSQTPSRTGGQKKDNKTAVEENLQKHDVKVERKLN